MLTKNNMKDLNQKNRLANYKSRYQDDFIITVLLVVACALSITFFVWAFVRASDMDALRTCEEHNDCSEVIKHINK